METVLVLEDEPLASRMMSAALRRKGYVVVEAATPTEAIRAGRVGTRFDLLIADVTLPERSGVRAAVEMYQTFPNLVVLFVSGTPFEGWDSRDLLTLQVLPRRTWEFLRKPFRAPTLDAVVRQLLDRSASAVAAASGFAHRQTDSVMHPTMENLLRLARLGRDVMISPNPSDGSISDETRTPRRIPDVVFCPDKVRLTENFLTAVQELNELQGEQTRAVIHDDPDFSRFDLLIHLATEKKEHAKYELIRHMELHHCEEGWKRWE